MNQFQKSRRKAASSFAAQLPPFGNDVSSPAVTNCFTPSGGQPAAEATEHHFTQKERDTESGNDSSFARYYSNTFGRFTTPDWSAKVEPVPYGRTGAGHLH